jgi:hypothetical protein
MKDKRFYAVCRILIKSTKRLHHITVNDFVPRRKG